MSATITTTSDPFPMSTALVSLIPKTTTMATSYMGKLSSTMPSYCSLYSLDMYSELASEYRNDIIPRQCRGNTTTSTTRIGLYNPKIIESTYSSYEEERHRRRMIKTIAIAISVGLSVLICACWTIALAKRRRKQDNKEVAERFAQTQASGYPAASNPETFAPNIEKPQPVVTSAPK